jgi:hypothetical protein
MKTRLFQVLIGCMIFSYTGCIHSFAPEIEKYDELMVVDGCITDGPGPYTIKLSKSVKLQERPKFNPYTGCKVYVEDELGNEMSAIEHEPGIYQTDSASFRGIVGRKYKLNISTTDGESYESAAEELLKGIAIQSVNAEVEHKTDPKLILGRDGYQFYVDAETPATASNYLMWRMQCTYKFQSDFLIYSYWENGEHLVRNTDTFMICYRTLDIAEVYLLNTNELKQKEIKRIPIHYEDNYTKALTIRYSLKVSQFTLNEAAYTYWSWVKKMMSEGGDLYTTQPFQVHNNLVNRTHSDKPVLGYFVVAGLSEKRIFVNHPLITNRMDVCDPPDPKDPPITWYQNNPAVWPVFLVSLTGTGKGLYLPQECMDCRVLGTKIKPAFWEE